MTEIELVQRFADSRGLTLRGKVSRVGAREILLPLLILDICYGYIGRIKADDFRHLPKKRAKDIHAAYNKINGWFFAGLKDQLEDAAIDLMDQLEESVNLDVMICETAVWNIFKQWPEPLCGQLVATYMTYLLAAGAAVAWEHSFRGKAGETTRNREMIKIQANAKRLAQVLMGDDMGEVQERRVKELRNAENVLGRKLVMWTRKEEQN